VTTRLPSRFAASQSRNSGKRVKQKEPLDSNAGPNKLGANQISQTIQLKRSDQGDLDDETEHA
jgi:hypothetical protein